MSRFVKAGAAILLCALLGACGITLRTPPAPVLAPPPPTDPVSARPNPLLATPSPDPIVLAPGQTVVSITFDDGRASDLQGAQILAAHGLAGTFFINSGNIGRPGYLSLPDTDAIATSGHEIGGHTINHPDLNTLSLDETTRQICEDRDALLSWGYPVRSFAYPFSSADPDIEAAVRSCGYNSARSLGETRTVHMPENATAENCALCAWAEATPPPDPYYTRAPAQVRSNWTLEELKRQVTMVTDGDGSPYSGDGGWVQLTFHGICGTDCSDITTPTAEFDQFVAWLADEHNAGHLIVRTVGEVIGGPVNPPAPAPPETTAVINPSLEATADGVPFCFMRAAYGDNHPEFSLTSPGHTGNTAEQLVMRDYQSGDAKLLATEDLGDCAVAVRPSSTPVISAWYTSTVPTQFAVQYRLARGVWVFGTLSPKLPPAGTYTLASFQLPPLPPAVTAISFGLSLTQDGELVTDDYALSDGAPR